MPTHDSMGMRLPRSLRWSTDSLGVKTLRAGILALLAAAAVALCGFTLDNTVYQPIRELPAKWVDGHFQSEPFWIASRASAYTINLELPDTRVPTVDHAVDFPDRHFVHRCGQPFPDGVIWSVRHFGHVIAQQSSDIGPWCEDASVERILRVGMGTFRASPGPGYSVRIEARRWPPSSNAPKLPLRLSLQAEAGQSSNFALAAMFLLYFLVWLGIICLPLGAVLVIMERFQTMERLEKYLQSRRDNDRAT